MKMREDSAQKNWLLHHDNAPSHFFSPGNFWLKTTWLSSPTHPTLYVSPIEDKTERPPFWHNWGDWGRIAGCAEHPPRTWLPGCI
jgi:hypothetical protein